LLTGSVTFMRPPMVAPASSLVRSEMWRRGKHSWGPVIAPKCVPDGLALDQLAMTLSLWRDIEVRRRLPHIVGIHGECTCPSGRNGSRKVRGRVIVGVVGSTRHHQPTWREAVDTHRPASRIWLNNLRHSLPTAVRFDGRCRQAEKVRVRRCDPHCGLPESSTSILESQRWDLSRVVLTARLAPSPVVAHL